MTKNFRPRSDVADLLRQGATVRTIKERLGVSGDVIAATRRAYRIPYPVGPGYRHSPEDKARLEQQVAALLLQGATYDEISAEVGLSHPTIRKIRLEWNIPVAVRPPRPSRTVAAGFALHTEAYGDGHLRWTGPYSGRMPTLFAESRPRNARHVAFRTHHGRDPDGHVRADCTEVHCMTGAHLSDTAMREARRAVLPGGEA